MVKNIVFPLAMMLSGIVSCNAAQPENIPTDNLVANSFDISKIADLAHPVCTLNLADNKNQYFYNYTEGDICPTGGGDCTYSAIMKLNGKMTILKQVSSGKETSVFKNDDISITTTQTIVKGSEEEGNDVNFIIVIKTKNSEKKFDMSGYCGV